MEILHAFGLTPIQLTILACAVITTGISKSGFAGGLGVLTIPMLSLVMSPILAVSLMLPVLLVMDVLSIRVWRNQFDSQLLYILIPAGIIGVILGYLTFSFISENALKVVLGGFTLAFAINGLFAKRVKSMPLVSGGYGCGILSGFTSFIAHAGGPPLNFFLLSLGLTKQTYLATAVMYYAVINLSKVPAYIQLGQFSFNHVVIALCFIPLSFVGVKLGVWMQSRLNETLFFRVIYILLIVLGIVLLSSGLS
ncbi:sulfite exporter TauE/SafE family protein [Aestuariibacter sp. AA17]|uniref:Probable membrane transporter protein n=1 Tax=Fluctibacter corallii TaxID=2984329 RepID=A0ABT3A624_9ALTE|nr:sulfite exporter TauE/SafE family protein [Aestuariibacter sp. AA17]MCV2884121.1 sulfite exporter TauE/SafE family protein [Aestuariibacter sp. AA17]